ncbi:MAG: hypothetical protein LUQ37_09545 [Methanoregulaceae archaeon]|jgi:hypothetical protein|nr:hypothetical protein [Methanoregulaceae archaeon]
MKLGHLQAEVHTTEFDLYVYDHGHVVMPPPRFIVALAGAECAGEISHASALKAVDFWREGFYDAIKKVVIQVDRRSLICDNAFNLQGKMQE